MRGGKIVRVKFSYCFKMTEMSMLEYVLPREEHGEREANCALPFIQPHFSFSISTSLGARGCSVRDKLIFLSSAQAFHPIRFRVISNDIFLLNEP